MRQLRENLELTSSNSTIINMVFFMFGPSYKSWALGNDVWSLHKSLPLGAHQLFEEKRVNGSNIEWASIGLTGLAYFSCYQQRIIFGNLSIDKYAPRLSYRTVNPNLMADTNVTPASMYNFNSRSIEHISFSPGGGWVITYSDKTVRVSMIGTFPKIFHEVAAQYLSTRGCLEAQASQIRYIFFGAGDTLIIVLWTGYTQVWGLPVAFKEAISSNLLQGRILGKSTSLCQWDSRFYFAEFVPATGWQSIRATYVWNIWPNAQLTDVLIREVTDGTIPVSLTAAVSSLFFQPPPPRPGVSIPTLTKSSLAIPWLSTYETSFREQVEEEFLTNYYLTQFKIMFENGEPYEGAGYATKEYVMAGMRGAANGIVTNLASQEVEITEKDLNKAWDVADENRDGKIDFEGFLRVLISIIFYAYKRSSEYEGAPNVTATSSASDAGCDQESSAFASLNSTKEVSLRTHDDYQIGIICALPVEKAAMVAMLDDTHPKLKKHHGDENDYTLGRIGVHNVVVACLPAGLTGNGPAAIVANNMQRSFPIKFGLMVGVGGGVWSKKDDIRLGDVVVSQPTGTHGGVVQWDFGKMGKKGGFQRTGSLDKPPPVLLRALQELRTFDITDGINLEKSLSLLVQNKPRMGRTYRYQGKDQDKLFEATYDHEGEETCNSCDNHSVVQRAAREDFTPRIHYGNIASGNEVMKHGVTRDKIAKEEGVICFEMEAAGLMDNFRCLVIRGICDYADSHKNKIWQPYASATAAAFVRTLLGFVDEQEVNRTPH